MIPLALSFMHCGCFGEGGNENLLGLVLHQKPGQLDGKGLMGKGMAIGSPWSR